MRRLLLGFVCTTMLLLSATRDQAVVAEETIRWDRAPIAVTLPVGTERYLWFPGRVQPGIPPELTGKLRVQAAGDTIYLLAKEPFDTTRLPVRDLDEGYFYLFDVRTDDEAPSTPVRVVKSTGRDEGTLTEPTTQGTSSTGDAEDFGYVALTRFAAKQIYAPDRLTQKVKGITKVPLAGTGQIKPGFYRGGAVEAIPIAGWRGRSGLYVTALKVANTTSERVALDPRLARGKWLAATFHHGELGAQGDPDDTSTLYLISDRPFLEVAQSWLG